jgi:hypothetical protein
MSSIKYQIPCDKCDCVEDEDKLIETFDNELLCSSCFIKKEFKDQEKTRIKNYE